MSLVTPGYDNIQEYGVGPIGGARTKLWGEVRSMVRREYRIFQ